jgi:hypothetical protein
VTSNKHGAVLTHTFVEPCMPSVDQADLNSEIERICSSYERYYKHSAAINLDSLLNSESLPDEQGEI